MVEISGFVKSVVYENKDNGFTVLKVEDFQTLETITVTGFFTNLKKGCSIKVTGDLEFTKYGEQIKAHSYEEVVPKSELGILKYLESGLIKGVGKVYAKRIVDKFGAETLDIIEATPERLSEVEGLGAKKCQQIIESFKEQSTIRNIMVYLQGLGISTNMSIKIYKHFGDKTISLVKENPYALSEEIYGIGFQIADQIAHSVGILDNSIFRFSACIRYILNRSADQGNTYLNREDLYLKVKELINISDEEYLNTLVTMEVDKKIKSVEHKIYLSSLYYCEVGIGKRLRDILNVGKYIVNEEDSVLKKVNKKFNNVFSEEQQRAISLSLKEKVLILTGGPGTGKTTTTKGIIAALKEINLNILICAPTGRAAKRIMEVTAIEAKTIHRMLEYVPGEGFMRNEDNLLEGDVLIIDEASMIDIVLFYNLLKAVGNSMSIIIIGDVDQLPAIGPGNVLKDLIDVPYLESVKFTKIYRQGEESKIIPFAHSLNNGIMINIDNQKEGDLFFLKESNLKKVNETILDLVTNRLPNSYGLDPIKDIQILVPLKKGDVSTKSINEIMQNHFTKHHKFITYMGKEYHVGDKVMQIKNNYSKNIYNGDLGYIIDVDENAEELIIDFQGEEVPYGKDELDEVILAYGITVHKSQGSEYKVLILPLVRKHSIMLYRKLIYTAVTRAKDLLIIIGEKSALEMAINNQREEFRNSNLCNVVKECIENDL